MRSLIAAASPAGGPLVRVGIPLTGGSLVAAARERGYPVLFSANAFAKVYGKTHERAGDFRGFSFPDLAQFDGLNAALDSAGFVAAVKYGDYRWTVSEYYDLVASYPWAFHAAMDYCCEPEIAGDRPLRLLRMAGTAQLLAQCREEARSRGLPMPMPVIQGYRPDEYAMCAEWLPVDEWPELVGIGSVCRRHVHGPNGILSILEALDSVLPPHVRCHLFGVKSSALALLANHPRVASVDSQAWDMQARAERRTGRDMAFRIGHMEAWADRQIDIAGRVDPGHGVQTSLFDLSQFGEIMSTEAHALECLAMLYAELMLSGNIDYRDAVSWAQRDAVTVMAIIRVNGIDAESLDMLDEVFSGLAEKIAGANQQQFFN
ncbi:hypothetical protein DBR42_22940 [Pelomonas sp. HMWF004]|nr:hypothetical protein DBR42_22940 [Pelomonas sp. HMWF004]